MKVSLATPRPAYRPPHGMPKEPISRGVQVVISASTDYSLVAEQLRRDHNH